LALLGTWIAAIFNSVIQGFYIEFNEDAFGSTLSANHDVFKNVNPMFGVFTLAAVALVLLAADYYTTSGPIRRVIGWVTGIGIIITTIGTALWTFLDPSMGAFYWAYILGMVIIGVSGLAASLGIYKARIEKITRSEL
jgi:steroid 5-alpha reductase family enzyme